MGSELAGKIAVITGAAHGIGRATAELFVAEGAKVVLSDIDAKMGEEVTAKLGKNAAFIRCDATQRAEVDAAVKLAIDRFGGLHVMCNNAGKNSSTPSFLEDDLSSWQSFFDLNVMSTAYGSHAAARHMAKNGGGSIINTASIAGVMAGFGHMPYRAMKAAVIKLSQALAIDLGEHNIRVNVLIPGKIRTRTLQYTEPGMTEEESNYIREATDAVMRENQPLKRQGFPMDVAHAAVFLASDRSVQMTGAMIPVDGGTIAGNGVNSVKAFEAARVKALAEVKARRAR